MSNMSPNGKPTPKRIRPLEARNGKGKETRILYVEDTAVIRDTIKRLLELSGYTVAQAKNGKEGVEKALCWNPDVVLMDLRMPVMDGCEAINSIKANPKTSHIPAFVISAYSSQKERVQARLAGADRFFVKPPDLNELIDAIDKAVAVSKNQ